MKIPAHGCPVCGYPGIDVLEGGDVTHEICPSCSSESGDEYGGERDEARLTELRRQWLLDRQGVWWSTIVKPPAGWSPLEQLLDAGLQLPEAGLELPSER